MREIRSSLRKIIEAQRAQADADKKSEKSAMMISKKHFSSRKSKEKTESRDDEQFDTILDEARKPRTQFQKIKNMFAKRDRTPSKETNNNKESRRNKDMMEERWIDDSKINERQISRPQELPNAISFDSGTNTNASPAMSRPVETTLKRQVPLGNSAGKQMAPGPPIGVEPSTAKVQVQSDKSHDQSDKETLAKPSPPDKSMKPQTVPKTSPVYVNLSGPQVPARSKRADGNDNYYSTGSGSYSMERSSREEKVQPTLITIETSGHARYRDSVIHFLQL
ncbi:hypothetical protein WR25_15828 [Diploscapter pachys]|uniref:Uncharacterized protein n=1 Tax=Diploscapter pachys TaxID=2018661 RepID=A0A2A2JQV6_9BILA|nr:hypothetical protein WR25_15828 [Diploscapter pachys]